MEEVWKDIKNWEGSYQVSNFGRVSCCLGKLKTAGGFKWQYE